MHKNLSPEEPQALADPKARLKVSVLLSAVVIVLTASSTYGMYYWQHTEVTALSAKLASADATINKMSKDLATLNARYKTIDGQYQALQGQYQAVISSQSQSPPSQSDLTLTVLRAARYTTGPCCQYRQNVAVVVMLKNPTKSTISIATTAFKLKDANDNSYFAQPGVASGPDAVNTYLGTGYVDLISQTLAPGDSVSGAIHFYVVDKSIQNYTLVNGDNTYPVTAN